ncbi:MAG: M23 family metallopeptidase [Sedimentibacter sp.]
MSNVVKFEHLPHDVCRVTSPFGYRTNPITGEKGSYHQGIDIGAKKSGVSGDNLYAVADGRVVYVSYMASKVYGYGYFVIIEHKGFCTLYAHMLTNILKVGQYVKAGQVVGRMGTSGASTAAHLHFEVEPIGWSGYDNYIKRGDNGVRKYNIDPLPYIKELQDRQKNAMHEKGVEEIMAEIKRYKNISEMPEFYQGYIKKWVDAGYINGKSDGSLDFTEDMIRCLIIAERMQGK